MAAETVVAEPHTATRADVQESEGRLRQYLQGTESRLRRELQLSEGRLRRQLQLADARVHREHQHYATKAIIQSLTAEINAMKWRLLIDLGGLTVVMVIIMIAVLKLF